MENSLEFFNLLYNCEKKFDIIHIITLQLVVSKTWFYLLIQLGSCSEGCYLQGFRFCGGRNECPCKDYKPKGIEYINHEWKEMDKLIELGRSAVGGVLDKLVHLKLSYLYNGRVIFIS